MLERVLSKISIIFFNYSLLGILLSKYAMPPQDASAGEYVSMGARRTASIAVVTLSISAAVTGVLDAFGNLTAIIPYVGTIISGLVTGLALPVALWLKAGNLLQAGVVFASFYLLRRNPGLTSKKDMLVYVVFGLLLANAIGGLVGISAIWFFFHVPARIAFTFGWADWIVSNIIMEAIIGIPVLRIVTPYVKNTRLYYGDRQVKK